MTSCEELEKLSLLASMSIKSGALSDIELNLPQAPAEFVELTISANIDAANKLEVHKNASFPLAIGPIFYAPITDAILLTESQDVKKIVDITIDVSGHDINFQPGDTVGIVPRNSEHEVNIILRHLNLLDKANFTYTIQVIEGTSKKNAQIPSHIPTSATIRHVLQDCLEINSMPKKLFLRVLADHTSDVTEKRRLEELCSRQGAKEYTQFIVEARTTFLDILHLFPSCCPPIERLLEFLPRLIARPYSIASSPLAGSRFHVVFSLLEFPQKNNCESKRGVCTGWLYTLAQPRNISECDVNQQLNKLSLSEVPQEKPKVALFLRKSSGFRLPNDPSIPLILIGPGTGVAPFIGFLQHREYQRKISPAMKIGEVWLFYGCRHPEKDFIYKHEMETYLESKILTRLFVASSRNSPCNGSVKYVQDNIKLHSKEFATQLLESNCVLYVCGDEKNMGHDVFEAVVAAVKSDKNLTDEEAYATVNELKSSGRYVQDIWI